MKTRIFFIIALLCAVAQGAWAQSYITDVMLVGADDDDEAEAYYDYYTSQGWSGFYEDLNNNAGGHYIYLLYKTNRSPGNSGRAITDFYLRVMEHDIAPGSLVHNGRTYSLAGYDGDGEFKSQRGDLNCQAGGYWIHLYYTKDDGDLGGVNNLYFNNNKAGALGENGGGTPCDLNKDAGGDDIFMHFNHIIINKWEDYRSNGFSHKEGKTIYIENEAELAQLAYEVNQGYDVEYTFVLNKDLDMSAHTWTAMGNKDKPFRSNFDGNGHTINGIRQYSMGSYNGFFGYVLGRREIDTRHNLSAGCDYIRNLTLTNCHISGGDLTGGVAGYIKDGMTLENVVYQGDVKGYNHVGGLIGKVEGFKVDALNIWLFDKIAYVKNCLFANGKIAAIGNRGATIGTIGEAVDLSNIYYGDPASDVGNANDVPAYPVTVSVPEDVTISYTSPGSILFNNVIYSPAGTVSFALKYDFTQYVTVKMYGKEMATTEGKYSVTINPATATSYEVSVTTSEITVAGIGTEANPYLITNEAEWNYLANYLNFGQAPNNYSGMYLKLAADIKVTGQTMGTEDHPFRGTFDGDGHTLTLAFGSAESYLNKSCAPFSFIDGATIKNLIIDGSIYSSAMFNSGLACKAIGVGSLIRNCVSGVNIYSNKDNDCRNGGFIGDLNVKKYEDKHTTFEGCAFVGAFQGRRSGSWGGFIGWLNFNMVLEWETVIFTDCLFAPTAVNIGTPIAGVNGAFCSHLTSTDQFITINYNNCYYTKPLQKAGGGKQAYSVATMPANIGAERTDYGFVTAYANGLKCGDSYYVDNSNVIILADNADNSQVINANDGKTCNVILSGRPLYKDGGWNTLCLPFDLELSGSPLDGDGVKVRTLSSSTVWNGTLTLRFAKMGDNAVLKAGVPYLIKWDNVNTTLTEAQLVFKGVTIKSGLNNTATEQAQFVGTFNAIDNQTASDMGAYVLKSDGAWYRIGNDTEEHRRAYIPACRGYLLLSGNSGVRRLSMVWDDTATGMKPVRAADSQDTEGRIFDLGGRQVKNPSRGIFVINGKKVKK